VGLFGHVAGTGRRFRLACNTDLGVRTLERPGVLRGRHADAGQFGYERWF